MHMVIGAIVYARDETEALRNARNVFEGLCGDDKLFDYFVTFDENGMGMSGSDRWGKMPAVSRADSQFGKKFIKENMEYTKTEFIENLAEIRKALKERTDDELSEDTKENILFRMRMSHCGETRGTNVFLYDNDGEGILSPSHLADVLDKWKSVYKNGKRNPYTNKKAFLVPADVHY